jgi:hypothetical protein
MKEFIMQASNENFAEERTVAQFLLDLRTKIEIAALAIPDVKAAQADWKSFLANVITQK